MDIETAAWALGADTKTETATNTTERKTRRKTLLPIPASLNITSLTLAQ
jgi:hypothetical protein